MEPFDAEYLERLKNGDPETEEDFAGHFRKLVTRVRAHRSWPDIPDDVWEDGLRRVLSAVRKGIFDQPSKLVPFSLGVLRNVRLEFLRRSRSS